MTTETAEAPAINEPLLRQAMEHIQQYPEDWNQRQYGPLSKCGSTYCFAGWAYVLGTGQSFNYGPVRNSFGWVHDDGTPVQFGHSEEGDVRDAAAELLGLTDDQADDLFYFTSVNATASDGTPTRRHPTFGEFAAKVTAVTGVKIKVLPTLDDE